METSIENHREDGPEKSDRSLEQLLDVYRRHEAIPLSELGAGSREELEREGYVISKARIVHVADLSSDDLAVALGMPEMTSVARQQRAKDRVQGDLFELAKRVGAALPDYIQREMLSLCFAEVDRRASRHESLRQNDTLTTVTALLNFGHTHGCDDTTWERFCAYVLPLLDTSADEGALVGESAVAKWVRAWNCEQLRRGELAGLLGVPAIHSVPENCERAQRAFLDRFASVPGVEILVSEVFAEALRSYESELKWTVERFNRGYTLSAEEWGQFERALPPTKEGLPLDLQALLQRSRECGFAAAMLESDRLDYSQQTFEDHPELRHALRALFELENGDAGGSGNDAGTKEPLSPTVMSKVNFLYPEFDR